LKASLKSAGVFVAGTDTGVGKTIVTAVLISALKAQGIRPGVMKPIETGVSGGTGSDAEWLMSVAEVRDGLDLVGPYRFKTVAAPLVASSREAVIIEPDRILRAFEMLRSRHDCVVVEGIGGIMVPLAKEMLVVDLIRQLHLSVLIVARAGLGSINHTLLTLEALRSRQLPVIGMIFNNPTPGPPEPVHDTIPTILRLTGQVVFGELPYCEGLPATWDQYRPSLLTRLNTGLLWKALGIVNTVEPS
jgi:dethiobiotin synthetase